MRLTYSKKGDPRGRHLVMVCDLEERYDALELIKSDVLVNPDGSRVKPNVETDDEGITYYRFALKWLDRLMLVFPEAELSPGIREVLNRAELERLAALPMPKYKFPGFTGEFWGDFQAQGAHQIVLGNIDFLNDEMGLGKTYQLLAALCKKIHDARKKDPDRLYRALIVVPNNTKYTWAKAILESFDLSYVVIDGQVQDYAKKQHLIENSGVQVTIVNTEAIRARPVHAENDSSKAILGWQYTNPALFVHEAHGEQTWFARDHVHDLHGKIEDRNRNKAKKVKWDFLCVDEYHRMKNPNAQVTYGLFGLQAKDVLFMSGTPILNRPTEIWSVLHKLYPETFNSYTAFCKVLKKAGTKNVNGYNPEAMAELRDFLQEVSLRRRKDQVRDDLPEVVNIVHKVEMTEEQRKIYTEVKEEFILTLEDGTVKDIMGMLPQITRLKQAALSPELYGGSKKSIKIEKLREIVAELVANGEKAVVFSQWSKATQIIKRELAEFNPAYVTGEDPSLIRRQAEIDRFREDPNCKLYIGTIGANREGVNLGSATYVIFTDLDWVPAGKDQAVGRSAAGGLRGIHLADTEVKVHVIEIQAEGTIEEWIQDLLEGKRQVFGRMVERDGGRHVQTFDTSNVLAMLKREGLGRFARAA